MSRPLDKAAAESVEQEFVTNAAHQLQSPLTAIISAIEVLQAGAKDTPERDVFLGHIEQAAARLTSLARSLLVLARAQLGSEAPKTEVVALEPMLSELAARLKPRDGVELAVSCASDVAVVTNRDLVEQAVMNVAENAVKYTVTGTIELGAEVDDGYADLTVRDTGPGIAPAEHDRVFERFYRGAEAISAGSGLGLSIARAATQALGGEVTLESELGAGTLVRIRLPQGASLVRP